jgi:transcriptional regulator with GAF, ATPase, and Fis domain
MYVVMLSSETKGIVGSSSAAQHVVAHQMKVFAASHEPVVYSGTGTGTG